MRAAAEVLPHDLALTVEVVVDGEFGPANLHHVGPALATDEAHLVGLVGQLDQSVGLADHSATEALAALDDFLHSLFNEREVIGSEGSLYSEVVVEAVFDGRADAQHRAGEHALHRLGEHVGGGVAQHAQAVVGVDRHRLDNITVSKGLVEVA
ncbi:unannotated protein [freshwater metagenome]|uniref:Unannotated protein n=1 Tax=freshwater metagenome TaxID=449393 RepID=A0A6J7Q2D2_9ZZZZ